MKRKLFLLTALLVCIMAFSACSTDPQKEAFEKDFSQFCTNVSNIDQSISAIDSTSPTASSDLMIQLDSLNNEFNQMSALSFPEEYDYLVDLATEAGEFMNLAVENYHAAFDGEFYDADAAAIADQYYDRAYKRVQYMITFMKGEVPESSEISYQTSDEESQ